MKWPSLLLVLLAACHPRAASSPSSAPTPVPSAPDPAQPPLANRPAFDIEASLHLALGLPRDADASDDMLLDREHFVVSYNPKLNVPNWVAWHLDAADLGSARRTSGFHSDRALPRSLYVVRDADYVGSGYDRGHLCPSADRTFDAASNRSTFVFTNVHPQRHELNAGPWEKLESYERELARQGKDLFLVAGGLFAPEPERIGKMPAPEQRVAVPIASYKIIVVLERGQRADDVTESTPSLAVIMPNEKSVGAQGFASFTTTIRAVEAASHYDFHTRVPRSVQDALETRAPAQRP